MKGVVLVGEWPFACLCLLMIVHPQQPRTTITQHLHTQQHTDNTPSESCSSPQVPGRTSEARGGAEGGKHHSHPPTHTNTHENSCPI